MNDFEEGLADTAERTLSERHIETIRQVGGLFVEAMRVTSMPMVVTDSTLPGNPITFANQAFIDLSGYTIDELLGQERHFMNGTDTDPASSRSAWQRGPPSWKRRTPGSKGWSRNATR